MLSKNSYVITFLAYIQKLYGQLNDQHKRIFELEGEVCTLREQIKDLETERTRSKIIKDSSNSSLRRLRI